MTGNLEQLETDAGEIAFDGMAVGAAGLLIDANFNLLAPFYKAPAADQLFATTAPVAAAGHDLWTELGTVSKALLDCAAEVRPVADRLNSLRAEAAAFERRVADDDEWVADGDLIDENTARRNAVNAAWSAFQAAELAYHNKIVALVGGEPLVVNDGSNKDNMYGYRAEDLDNAGGLPRKLAADLAEALDDGKLDYVVVKGEKNAGQYAGYRVREFDIAMRSNP
ncbi:hypothetical protein [Streptomyces europaeiscabiei]|uniref:hypothetical protein n=1 Tax=Streptomyces europaeiscabiei TaxID=146819 RepID=UPI0029B0DDBD|nr:hypothetical protein [Streptomyces europaeiscabiei]MDX3584590.1 hypothetical protein [Streptomyces europaeiscabiei]